MLQCEFHGYAILEDSTIIGKKGKPLAVELRERRGGKFDKCVRLYYCGRMHKWTLSRLVVSCFQGPIHGYEVNHKDRDTMNCHNDNLEKLLPSCNQKHWREDEKGKKLK